MSGRGVTRIEDLYARSERRPGSGCWWWLGGASRSRVAQIWTFDHDKGEKASMRGPRAVWNIANGAGAGERYVSMRCGNGLCVNPSHVFATSSRKEIGNLHARIGKFVGNSVEQRRANIFRALAVRGVEPIAPCVVRAIRTASGTHMDVSRRLGVAYSTVRRIRNDERLAA